ncbi:cytochrome P450 2G1-like isoform X2 [Ambystoma mexicanum]|uniref:cytochrome P450 2G1-like isoform X2 n=1 Tax=Ambystoma mexicanum TaxID=8296 RepID=UPI0037E86592
MFPSLMLISHWIVWSSTWILFELHQQLSRKYGPVSTVHLGSKPVVVLYGYDAVREALDDYGEAFSGRGPSPAFDKVLKDYGFSANGERYKQMRRFSLTTLRDFGMGKRSIEERIQEEAKFLVEELRKTKESPFDPTHIFSNAVSNIICSIVFGKRFEYQDKEFLTLLHMIAGIFQLMTTRSAQLYSMFPNIMDYIPGSHHDIFRNIERIQEFVEKRVKLNRDTLDLSSPRDFLDCFLIRMEQDKQNPSSEFHMENLLTTVFGLFFAGTETVSTTLRYSILVLLKYPDIEEKIHKEINEVVGRNRMPSINDRSKMVYTDAVIHEIQRFCDLLPLGIPHTVTQDVNFRGFSIPKGTNVIPILSSALKDPKMFPSPEEFNPGRFLDDKGGFKRNQAFVPFSTGKRSCPGEGLARMELFLFLTTLLQNFRLKSLTDPKDINITPRFTAFSNSPEPFELCAIPF